MRLIEGIHNRRRENRPSPAPHKSKELVNCLLCSDLAMMTATNMLPGKGLGRLGKTFALIGSMHTRKAITRILVVRELRAYLQWASPGGHLALHPLQPRRVMIMKGWHLAAYRMFHHLRALILTSGHLQACGLLLQLRVGTLLLRLQKACGLLLQLRVKTLLSRLKEAWELLHHGT